MQTNNKITLFLTLTLLIILQWGCSIPGGPVEVILPANSPQRHSRRPVVAERQQGSGTSAKRFQEPTKQETAAVESAVELAEKYAKLSGETTVLEKKNRDLIEDNRQLKDQLATAESHLQQTKKELAESNSLLKEMLVELNNWKADILGFRDEMRDADKAQLQTLLKICHILGGEVNAELTQNEDTSSVSMLTDEIGQSEAQETSNSGK